MSAPKRCEVCGTEHHAHQGHVFPTERPPRVSHAVNRSVSHDESTTYRYRDKEARRAYQRDLMRQRRAAAKAGGK